MKTKKLLALIAITSLFSFPVLAASFDIGDELPRVAIAEGGQAVIVSEKVDYKAWSTEQIKQEGTVVVIAKAAREKTEKMVTPKFFKRLKASGAHIISIINADDAPFGADMLIESAISKGMIEDQDSEVILDKDGEIFLEWELEEGSAAIILVKDGKVAYFIEGALQSGDERSIIKIARTK